MIRYLVSISLLLTLAVAVAASPPAAQKENIPTTDPGEYYLNHGKNMLLELTRAVDVWHQANLDGDKQRITQAQTYIMAVLRSDLDYSWDYIGRNETELYRRAEATQELGRVRPTGRDDRADLRNEVASIKKVKLHTKAKERLWKSIGKAATFSNKYRLLGDYSDLLHQQTGAADWKLAVQNQADNREQKH